jgi:tetratricopeptide (TPR) repeat protein
MNLKKYRRLIFLLALAALPLLTHLPFLDHELIWDSRPMILENELLKGDPSFRAPFRSGYWETTSQRGNSGYDYYRPLTVLSFMAEKGVWGLTPWRLRFVNLLIFIAALFALYFFLRRQIAPPGVAETAVLLFALFPLHLDNINWVVGRCDLLMLFFGMLSLLLFDRFLERKSLWLGLFALASFALALFSKEAALFFLPLFPLHELIRRRRFTLPLYLPPLLVAGAFWLLKSTVIGRSGFPIRPFPTLWENVLPLLGTLGYYVRSLVFPFIYDMFLPVNAVRAIPYLAAGALFALFLVLVPVLGRKRLILLQAWFWIAPFLGGTLLMIFTPIYPFSISTRYLMVPAIGWTWLLGYWLATLRPVARRAALAVLLVASATAVVANSRRYRSETDFWKSALASCPSDSFFLTKYAGQLQEEGEFVRSETLLRRALAAKMKNATAVAISLQLADMAFAKARHEESLAWLEKMRPLKLDPLSTRHRLHRLLKIHMARGDLAAAETVIGEMARSLPAGEVAGKRIELYLAFAAWEKARSATSAFGGAAAAAWSRTIQREEYAFRSPDPRSRARYFIGRGSFAAAWEAWPDKDAPGIAEQLQTARLALLAGREAEGQERIERLRQSHGDDFRVLNTAGNLLFDLQRADEALSFYERSLRLNPGQAALRQRVGWIRQAQQEKAH